MFVYFLAELNRKKEEMNNWKIVEIGSRVQKSIYNCRAFGFSFCCYEKTVATNAKKRTLTVIPQKSMVIVFAGSKRRFIVLLMFITVARVAATSHTHTPTIHTSAVKVCIKIAVESF